MRSLVEILLFLMLIVVPLSKSKESNTSYKKKIIFNVVMTVFVQHGSHAMPIKSVSVMTDTQIRFYVTTELTLQLF